MKPELEALVLAYDALREGRSGPKATQLSELFESRVDDALAGRPGVNRESFVDMIRLQHTLWCHAQKQTTTLPPKA